MTIASNRSLAEFNLSKEPDLEELKAQVQEKSEAGEQLCTRIQELLEEYSEFNLCVCINIKIIDKKNDCYSIVSLLLCKKNWTTLNRQTCFQCVRNK